MPACRGSPRGWQLFTPAALAQGQAQQEGQLGSPLVRGHQALGRDLTYPWTVVPSQTNSRAIMTPVTHSPTPSLFLFLGSRVLVPMFPH